MFWGDLDHSKATLEVLGGNWFFEHTEMTGSGIDVMHLSGDSGQTVLRRCITGGVDEEYRKAADAFVVSGSTRLYAVGCTLTHITRSAVKVLDDAQVHLSSSTVENCCVAVSASGGCKVAVVSSLIRNAAPELEAIQVRFGRSNGTNSRGCSFDKFKGCTNFTGYSFGFPPRVIQRPE